MKPLIWICAGVLAAVVMSFGSALILQHKYEVPNQEQQAISNASAAAPQFGAEQNDSEGYDGSAWGSQPPANSAVQPVHDNEDYCASSMLNKIVGAPGHADRFGQYRGDPSGDLLFEVGGGAPKLDCFRNQQTGTYAAYYQGKLAFTFTRLQGDYQQVESTLDGKYSMQREITEDAWGDGTNDAVASPGSRVYGVFTGKLYRRGNTNTRIYLLQEIINGFPNNVWLVYIPNAYLTAIHNEWWANFQRAQREETQKQEKQNEQIRQADEHKIQ